MVSSVNLTKVGDDEFENPSLYRSVIGSLQYATITRPDIVFSVNKLNQYMQRPLQSHWKCAKRLLRYIAGIVTHGLVFHPSSNLRLFAFSDSEWGSNLDDRQSTAGFCIYMGSNLVFWSSRKQSSVSRSNTKAEYRSLATVDSEII
nr:uncharacterized protein LOC114925768 [Arachis hypogaea]